jgi:hypothetical protein
MAMDAIARLGETLRGVRLPTRRGGVGHPPSDQVSFFLLPFSFPGVRCAALRLPSLVWNNGGIGQARNGVRWFGGIKNRMVVEQKRKHTNFAQTARFSSRKNQRPFNFLVFWYVYALARVDLLSFTETSPDPNFLCKRVSCFFNVHALILLYRKTPRSNK